MAFFFESSLDNQLQNIAEHFRELLNHTGIVTASPAIVDDIPVEHQGYTLPIVQLATIRVMDRRSLLVDPWDKTALKVIEKAIIAADRGVMVSPEGQALRVTLSPVTTEDKERIIKHVLSEKEQARISVRLTRDKIWREVQKKANDGELTEDQKFSAKEALEKTIEKANAHLDELTEKKITHIKES